MINLLPNSVREEHVYGRRNRKLLSLAVLGILTAVSVGTIMYLTLGFVGSEEANVRQSIDENQTLITSLEAGTADVSRVVSRLDTTYKLFEGSIKFSEVIPKIGSLLPKGTVIDSLSLTGGSTDPLSLSVSSANPDLIPVLQKNLVESELFEAADIISITPIGSDGPYAYSASMSVSFTGSADSKKKAAAAAAAAQAAQKQAEGESE